MVDEWLAATATWLLEEAPAPPTPATPAPSGASVDSVNSVNSGGQPHSILGSCIPSPVQFADMVLLVLQVLLLMDSLGMDGCEF